MLEQFEEIFSFKSSFFVSDEKISVDHLLLLLNNVELIVFSHEGGFTNTRRNFNITNNSPTNKILLVALLIKDERDTSKVLTEPMMMDEKNLNVCLIFFVLVFLDKVERLMIRYDKL